MLKVGWVSASPVAQTGYGRETREIGYRLVDMEVDVHKLAKEKWLQ